MSFLYRFTSGLLRCYFRLFYRFSVHGTSHPLKGKAILASNHNSFLDPPIIGAAWPEEVHYLARASLFRRRWWGMFLSKLNAHPVSGSTHDIHSFRLICKLLENGDKVVIFPEGERSPSGELLSIKSGIAMLALRTKSPIIPVYLKGTFEAWPRHSFWPKFGMPIICVFGKPIFIEAGQADHKKKRQEEITRQIQKSLENLKQWLECGANGEPP